MYRHPVPKPGELSFRIVARVQLDFGNRLIQAAPARKVVKKFVVANSLSRWQLGAALLIQPACFLYQSMVNHLIHPGVDTVIQDRPGSIKANQ